MHICNSIPIQAKQSCWMKKKLSTCRNNNKHLDAPTVFVYTQDLSMSRYLHSPKEVTEWRLPWPEDSTPQSPRA